MSEERKANVEAMVAELEHALWLAIKQGAIKPPYQWSTVIETEGDPWFAVLTVGQVEEDPRGR
jgi:hypothetical protein